MGEIASASEEETRSLAKISSAMGQVNSGAQSASSQSEELASTADELGGLAERLREEVARFQLRRQQGYESGLGSGAELTPEMLQALNELTQQKPGTGAASAKAKLAAGAKSGNGKGVSTLDRDARGYGQF